MFTALVAFTLITSAAYAEEPGYVLMPPITYAPAPYSSPIRHTTRGAKAKMAVGGVLIGVGIVGVVGAVGLGLHGALNELCGYDHPDMDCTSERRSETVQEHAAIGLAVAALVTEAIGVPLLNRIARTRIQAAC